jgi:hypothetical protein
MSTTRLFLLAALSLAAISAQPSVSAAEPAPMPAKPAAPPAQTVDESRETGDNITEPAVLRTVVEDQGTRIDELKVRGQSKRITVTPKNGAKPYEIITPTGARDQTEGPNGSNGATGKRVWPVLSF